MQIKTHLNIADRRNIEYYLRLKLPLRTIGGKIGRDHAVVVREIERNKGPDGRYRAESAQKKADHRRRPYGRKLEKDGVLHDHVVAELRRGRSPDKIAGRLKYWTPAELAGRYVCRETIYDYIYNGEGRHEGLYGYLWYKRKKRRKRFGRKPQNAPIIDKISVRARPESGLPVDWESDSMTWHRSRPALSVQTNRSLLLNRLRKTADRSAEETVESLRRTVETVPDGLVRTMTFDNGSENAGHAALKDEYNIDTFFCDPYASWQKPQVENQNRVIRHFLPRTKDFAAVTDREVRELEDYLNNLPRRSLYYLTPDEALQQYLACGALET